MVVGQIGQKQIASTGYTDLSPVPGNRIKEIREEKHLEAKMLSMLTGINAANLCRIEQGKQSAGIDVLSKIANAM